MIKPFLQTCKENEVAVLRKINHFRFGTGTAVYWARKHEKEGSKMKNSMARKGAYLGAGAGLVLCAIFGLLPGSLIGGAMGINVAGWFFGLPLQPSLISRAIVLLSMLLGVLVAGIVMVTATSTVGWLLGRLMEGAPQKEEKEAMSHK